MTTLGLSSSRYAVGQGRNLAGYSHINSEDELRRLLKDIDDFEERRKIRARIREINEKNSYNSSPSYLERSSIKTNRYSDYTPSIRSTYTSDEISQRRRRNGVDESAKLYKYIPVEDTRRYSNTSAEDYYSRRYSNTYIDDKYITKHYRSTSIDEKYSSPRYSKSSLDDSYSRYSNYSADTTPGHYNSKSSRDDSYSRYSNYSADTKPGHYNSTRKDSSDVFKEDETNNNLQNGLITEDSLPSQMTDYESYRSKKEEEESKEVWSIEEFSEKTVTELENLLNGTRNFKKRRDIRTVIRSLKERDSSYNSVPSERNQKKISYGNADKISEFSQLDEISIGNYKEPITNKVNDVTVTFNMKITPKQELLSNKLSKSYYDDDDTDISKINTSSRFYSNSSKSMESKIIQEINDLKDVSELQTSINSFLPTQEISSKSDILKEEHYKYPPKRMLSKRSSGYSSSYSSIDDDKEEEKDDVFEKEVNKEDEGNGSDLEVEHLRENLRVFAEIQRAKENASFHPTVDEIEDEEEAEEEEADNELGMTISNNSSCKIEEVSDDYPETFQSSSTVQIVTYPDDERNIPITIIKEEPEEICEEIDETLENITAEPLDDERKDNYIMENTISEPVEDERKEKYINTIAQPVEDERKKKDVMANIIEPVENRRKENYSRNLSPKVNQFEQTFKIFQSKEIDNGPSSVVEKVATGKENSVIFERYGKAVTIQKDVIKTSPSKVPVYVAENRRRIVAKMEQFGHSSTKSTMSAEQLANLPNINDEEELTKLLDSSDDYDARKKIRERLKEVRQKRREKTESDIKRREDDREKMIQDKLKSSQDQQSRTLAMYDEMAKSAPAGAKKSVNIETYKTGDGTTKTVTTTTIKGDSDKDGTKSSTNIKETKSVTISASKDPKDAGSTLANAQDMISKMSNIPGVTGQVKLTTTTSTYSSKDGGPPKVQVESKTQTFGTPGKGMSPAQPLQKLEVQAAQNRPTSPNQLSSPVGRPVSRSPSAIKDMLLNWCAAKTKGYEHVNVTNFSSAWNDGMAFCALIHHFIPDGFDYSKLDPKNRRYNFDLAFKTAEEKADISPLLDTDDMVMMKNPDWKCVFCYVQSIYRRFHNVP